jgi:hypothetical protein
MVAAVRITWTGVTRTCGGSSSTLVIEPFLDLVAEPGTNAAAEGDAQWAADDAGDAAFRRREMRR